MYYHLNCQGCDLELRISQEHEGKIVQCPSCGARNRIILSRTTEAGIEETNPIENRSSGESNEVPQGAHTAGPVSDETQKTHPRNAEPTEAQDPSPGYESEPNTLQDEAAITGAHATSADVSDDASDSAEEAIDESVDEVTDDGFTEAVSDEGKIPVDEAEDALGDVEPETVEPEVQLYFGYEFKVDLEAISASLTMVNTPDPIRSKAQLMATLREHDVTYGLDDNQIRIAFMYLDGEDPKELGVEFTIARGTAAIPGRNGRVDFAVDVTGAAQFQVAGADDDGRVNFKEATRIAVVRPGQLLARLIPPTRGRRGTGLNGQETPAMPGDAANITIGEGARADESGKEFYAMIEGRPIFEKGILSVAEVYEIEGDVDYETGNVRFGGHVVVHGMVLDDFEVDCKSLEVHGTVGSARITTEGDAFLHGGVNGQERGRLTIGGNLITKYLNQVNATVEGHVVSERGITNSTLHTSGDVQAERIVGGDTVALLGIEVNFLGSDLGVVTQIQAGVDYRQVEAEQTLQGIDERLPELQSVAMPYLKPGPALKSMPEKRREDAKAAFEEYKNLSAQRILAEQTLATLEADTETEAIPMVNVGSEIFSDVVLRNGIYVKEYKSSIKGQMTFMPDEELNTWEMHPYRKRPVKLVTEPSDE